MCRAPVIAGLWLPAQFMKMRNVFRDALFRAFRGVLTARYDRGELQD
jgi:hypothetical protein